MDENFIDRIKELVLASRMDSYWKEIKNRNYNNFKRFTTVSVFVMLCITIYGLFMEQLVDFNANYMMLLVYLLCIHIFSYTFASKCVKNINTILYITLIPIIIMGILMGTYFDNDQPAITIMILLCTLPLIILDRPWRVFLFIFVVAVAFAICSFVTKEKDIFMADMVDLVSFTLISVGINLFILNERLDNVENYMLLREESKIDHLTGIYNRGAGVEQVNKLLKEGKKGAFIIIDIDDFKQVNDSYGHIYGDRALKYVSKEIGKFCEPEDVYFRMGGDEFAIFSTSLYDEEKCRVKLTEFINNIKLKEISSSLKFNISVSLGCSIFKLEDDYSTIDFYSLYKLSDKCLYEAKENGRGCCSIKVS